MLPTKPKKETKPPKAPAKNKTIAPPPEPPSYTINDLADIARFRVHWITGDPDKKLYRNPNTGELVAYPDYLEDSRMTETDETDYIGEGQFAVLLGPLTTRQHMEYRKENGGTLENQVYMIEEAIAISIAAAQEANYQKFVGTQIEALLTENPENMEDWSEADRKELEEMQKQIEQITVSLASKSEVFLPNGDVVTSYGTLEGGISVGINNLMTFAMSAYGRVVGVKEAYVKHPGRITGPHAFDLEDVSQEEVADVLPANAWRQTIHVKFNDTTEGDYSLFREVLWRADMMSLSSSGAIADEDNKDKEESPKK